MKPKKKAKPLSFVAACNSVLDGTFKDLETPPLDLMERLLRRHPRLVLGVPQATKNMQIGTVKRHGSLLLAKDDWKFDVEAEFPGSTIFHQHFVRQWQKLTQVDATQIRDVSEFIHQLMDHEWQRISRLSEWGVHLGPTEREVLKSFEYEEAMAFIDALLKNGQPHLRTSKTAIEDFGESLNNAMECA